LLFAEQKATDAAFLETNKAEIISTGTDIFNEFVVQGTYDVSNVAAGNIKDGVWIGGVEGTYTGAGGIDPADIVGPTFVLTGHDNYVGGSAGSLTLPTANYVSTENGAYGVGGTGSTPTLNMSLYCLISTVVAAAYVLEGHDNRTGGDAGTLAASSVLVAAGGTFDESARNTDPGEANVWTGTSYKIANVSKSGSKVASSITNCSAGNIKDDVVIGDVTGTYTGSGVGSTVYMIGLKAS
jgi:hypothetical protein